MPHISEKDRAAARYEECGNIYTVNIDSGGKAVPVGVPTRRGCGGSEVTIFGKHGEELIQTDE